MPKFVSTGKQRLKAEEAMQTLARMCDTVLNGDGPKEIGFAVLAWRFDQENIISGATVNYIGNAERDSLLQALKQIVQRWEAGEVKH